MVEIPSNFQKDEFRFVLIKPNDKKPFEKEWTTKNNYSFNDQKVKNHNGNIGILTGIGDLIILDCDCQGCENIARWFPKTLVIGTSNASNGYRKKHFYFKERKNRKRLVPIQPIPTPRKQHDHNFTFNRPPMNLVHSLQ